MSTTSLSLSRQGLPLRTAHNLLNRQRLSKSRAFVAAAPRAEAAPQAEPAVPHEQQQLAAQAPPEPRAVMPRAFSPLATSSFGRMQQARPLPRSSAPSGPRRRMVPAPSGAL